MCVCAGPGDRARKENIAVTSVRIFPVVRMFELGVRLMAVKCVVRAAHRKTTSRPDAHHI